MQLSVEIKPDFHGSISITDYTQEMNEYIAEDIEQVLPSYDHFKYSQTCTINAISYISSKGEELINIYYSNHRIDNDSIRIPLQKDGYYIVEHIVLPTVEWFNLVKDQDLSYYNMIYVTDGRFVYKYINGELIKTNPIEILQVNPYLTTISSSKFQVFSIDRLKHCYAKIARKIMDNYAGKCAKIDDTERFNRDFLWMTLNVISYYLEWDMYTEAQLVLEDMACNNFCPDSGEFKGGTKSCGCQK